MNISFSKKYFLTLFFSATVSAGAELIVDLFDGIIAGLMIGDIALTAVAIIVPTYLFTFFISGLVIKGSSYEYSRALGMLDKKRADEIVGQCIIVSVSLGVLLFSLAVLFKGAFFDFLHISESVRAAADAYFKYYKFMYLLLPVEFCLEVMVYIDGDSNINSIASTVGVIVHVVLPIMLINKIGVTAVAFGNVGCIFSMIIIYCIHFFKKSNNLHFKWYFSIKDLRRMITLSLADSVYMLCSSLVGMILNKFVIAVYSEKYIPILTVTIAVFQLTVLFQTISNSLMPIGEVYTGENNLLIEKEIYHYSLKIALFESIALLAVVVVFASSILKIYGISDHELTRIGITSIRLMACSLPFMALSFILSSHNVIIRNIVPAVLFMFSGLFALPLLIAIAFGLYLSYSSIFLGFAVGTLISLLLAYYVDTRMSKKANETTAPLVTISQSYYINEDAVINIRDKLEDALLSIGCPQREVLHMLLLVEEYILNVIQRNSKKVLFGEFSIIVNEDNAIIYLKDNGEIFDWADPDSRIVGMSSYTLNNLLHTYEDKRYVSVLNYNRVVFTIKIN